MDLVELCSLIAASQRKRAAEAQILCSRSPDWRVRLERWKRGRVSFSSETKMTPDPVSSTDVSSTPTKQLHQLLHRLVQVNHTRLLRVAIRLMIPDHQAVVSHLIPSQLTQFFGPSSCLAQREKKHPKNAVRGFDQRQRGWKRVERSPSID